MKKKNPEEKKLAQEQAQFMRKELRRKRIMTIYIESAEQLLLEGGIQNLSIRKLSELTGYSSATLYSYFGDMDELTLFASLKFRKEYLKCVMHEIHDGMTSLEQYRKIYEIFNEFSFSKPEIHMNMFFGRHSDKIKAIKHVYYELFPEEFLAPTELMRALLLQGTLLDCDRVATERMAADGYIRPENAENVAQLMVRVQETFLYDMAIHSDKSIRKQSEEFMKLFDYIISVS